MKYGCFLQKLTEPLYYLWRWRNAFTLQARKNLCYANEIADLPLRNGWKVLLCMNNG